MLSNLFFLVVGAGLGVGTGGLLVVLYVKRKPPVAPGGHGPKFYFSRVEGEGFTVEGDIKKMNVKAGKSLIATVRFKDQFGNAAPIQSGSGVATSSDETIATVSLLPEEPDANGQVLAVKARVRSLGPVGAAQINITADGDLSAAEKPIPASGAVNVVPGDAVTSEIEFEEEPEVVASSTEAPTSAGTGTEVSG